jgi:hypothetical protein
MLIDPELVGKRTKLNAPLSQIVVVLYHTVAAATGLGQLARHEEGWSWS